MSPAYRYHSLPQRDSIRLLRINPGQIQDPVIRCSLSTHTLDQPPNFEALSYTWGDAFNRETVSLPQDGTWVKLSLTRNCYNAIRALRHENSSRCVWIDAICINQNDDNEKTCQVRIMGQIYSMAERTIAYLGEHTTSSRYIFKELQEAEKGPRKEVVNTWGGANIKYTIPKRRYPSPKVLASLEQLFLRPWFSRIWVLQEVHLAKDVVMMCDKDCVSKRVIQDCMHGYRSPAMRATSDIPPVVFSLRDMTDNPAFPHWEHRIWSVLNDSRKCQATDPRDKVFALTGLAFSTTTDPAFESLLNYHCNTDDIYKRLGIIMLKHLNLIILSAVRYPHKRKMPSWIPDWTQAPILWMPSVEWNMSNGAYDNCSISKPKTPSYYMTTVACDDLLCLWNDNNHEHEILKVQGLRCGQIVNLGMPFQIENHDDAKEQAKALSAIFKELIRAKISPSSDLRSQWMSTLIGFELGMISIILLSQLEIYVFVILMCAQLPLLLGFWQLSKRFLVRKKKSMAQLATFFVTVQLLEAFLAMENISEAVELFLHKGRNYHKKRPYEVSPNNLKELHGSRMFVTELGSVGILPDSVREGDMVVIVQGAYTPYVFRARPDGYWEIITGECQLVLADRTGKGLQVAIGTPITIGAGPFCIDEGQHVLEEFSLR